MISDAVYESAPALADLDVCGNESCPGDSLSLVCTLPVNHDGFHRQESVPCGWRMSDEWFGRLLRSPEGTEAT